MLLPNFAVYSNAKVALVKSCDLTNANIGTLQIAYSAKMRSKSMLKNEIDILQIVDLVKTQI